jgi:L-seryl-tRNA(Ser) seleniumtransferase
MRVHTSNYRIVGFTKTPTLPELAGLAHNAGLPLYEDAGSGAIVNFATLGIAGEPVIAESIDAGVDVISFSGDKLLGGPQAGLVVGRKAFVDRLKANPMYRAVRADKLALAALEATLDAYRRGASFGEVPVHRMIAVTAAEIRARSLAFIDNVGKEQSPSDLKLVIVEGESAIGGGSGPTSNPATVLIGITHENLTPDQIESALRRFSPPVIARIAEDRVLLDLRTVAEDEVPALVAAVTSLR